MMRRQARNMLVLGAAAIAAAACGGGSDSSGPSMSGGGPQPSGLSIGALQNVAVNQDTTAVVPLMVTDMRAPMSSLTVTATAADNTLVLPQGIQVQTDNGTPTLHLTPAEDATGSTVIQVSATDPASGMAQQSFTLTVNAVNISFTTFSQSVLAKAETDTPATVNGFMLAQDADDSMAFDSTVQQGSL
jgi:hypothetical protein